MLKKWYDQNKKPIWVSGIFSVVTLLMILILFWRNIVTIGFRTLPVRSGPAVSYRAVKQAKKGERYTILSEQYGWYRVRSENGSVTGWIPSWLARTNRLVSGADTPSMLDQSTIMLDPGHGGADSGSLHGSKEIPKNMEKTYTLKTGLASRDYLQKHSNARVLMTRDRDLSKSIDPHTYLLDLRTVAKKAHPDAFVSIHFDSSDVKNTASGFTTYYYHDGNGSAHLSRSINDALDGLPLQNRGNEVGDFLVVRDIKRPATLLELGYINSRRDFKQIKKTSYQKNIAKRVTKGLQNYFNEVLPRIRKDIKK